MGSYILDAPGGAELVTEVSSSPNLFSVLGVEPVMGRGFKASAHCDDFSEGSLGQNSSSNSKNETQPFQQEIIQIDPG